MCHHERLMNGESLSVLGFMHDFPIKSPIWEKGEGIKAKAESSFCVGPVPFGALQCSFLSQLILSFTPINQDRVSPNKNSLHNTFFNIYRNIVEYRRRASDHERRVPEKKCLYPIFPGDECEIPGQLASALFHFHRKSTSIDQMKNFTLRFIV